MTTRQGRAGKRCHSEIRVTAKLGGIAGNQSRYGYGLKVLFFDFVMTKFVTKNETICNC